MSLSAVLKEQDQTDAMTPESSAGSFMWSKKCLIQAKTSVAPKLYCRLRVPEEMRGVQDTRRVTYSDNVHCTARDFSPILAIDPQMNTGL